MHTPLEKYFAQREKNLFNHLHDFETMGDEVSLHDLRVEMKKLRAIIKFLRNIYSKSRIKKPAHILRAIFQQAGEIREYQIISQWLQKNNFTIIEQTYFPTEELKQMIREFQKETEHLKNRLNDIIETIAPFIENTNEILAEQYFIDINAQLEQLCRKDLPQTEWHELRKFIKQRIYAYNWVTRNIESEDSNFSYYQKLQEMIGLWHDLIIIKDTFSHKQVYLSSDIEVQKDFMLAWDKLTTSLKQREKQIEDMLSKQLVHE
jgi:CHAD domain-containing protein